MLGSVKFLITEKEDERPVHKKLGREKNNSINIVYLST